ncbi:hypothetical protein C8J56DRAFT_982822 [Mycena floridula]|nr:hypothetical protein C8J56DRAFT_982822 [Mycena floridula]
MGIETYCRFDILLFPGFLLSCLVIPLSSLAIVGSARRAGSEKGQHYQGGAGYVCWEIQLRLARQRVLYLVFHSAHCRRSFRSDIPFWQFFLFPVVEPLDIIERWSAIRWSAEQSVSMIVASSIDSPYLNHPTLARDPASPRTGSLFALSSPGSRNETLGYRRGSTNKQDFSLDPGRRRTNEAEMNE